MCYKSIKYKNKYSQLIVLQLRKEINKQYVFYRKNIIQSLRINYLRQKKSTLFIVYPTDYKILIDGLDGLWSCIYIILKIILYFGYYYYSYKR